MRRRMLVAQGLDERGARRFPENFQSMIRKSGNRFSEKIMLKKEDGRRA